MTTRQQQFIVRLTGEKVVPTDTPQGLFVTRMVTAINSGVRPRAVSTAQASRIIDYLLGLPNREQQQDSPRQATPAAEVPAGRYALVGDGGVVKFYSVDRPTEGRWAGYTFVNALASDERHPIRNRTERDRILSEIAQDEHIARVRYGIEIGRCGYCGRTLTDEVSRAAGIGPDCADRHGVDRTAYTALAEALAAARERGEFREDGEDDGYAPSSGAAPIVPTVFTLYVDGQDGPDKTTYRDEQEAVMAARRMFQENPMRRISVVNDQADLVVEYDL